MRIFTVMLWLTGSGLFAQQPRFPQLKVEDTTAGDQRALAERMLKETRVGLGGPWNVMLRSPEMGKAMIDLYHYFRWNSALPSRIVELGILIAAKDAQSPYEWFVHYPLALKEGVSAAALAEIKAGKRPGTGLKADELAAYEFASELLRTRVVSDATYRKAKSLLTEKGVVDLTALAGTYVAIGGLLNVSEVWGDLGDGPGFLPKPGRK